MNSRYWIRIALGVALVFTLGMVGMAAARRGKAEVKGFLSTAATRLPLELANLQFRIDGRSVGRISGFDVAGAGSGGATRLAVSVRLAEGAALESLRECSVTAEDVRHFNANSSFRCATAAELASGELTEVGEITFEPGNLARPLLLPADIATKLRQAGHSNASVSIRANESGASIQVTDQQGRKVVDVQAGR